MAAILIVDDLSANRKLLVMFLRHHGHRLLEASDGREALAVVQAEHPDLVITDVLMPVMDGYELVRQLRLDPTTSGIPVLFYTAHYGEREARALALTGGVFDVLSKPVDFELVLQVVNRALSAESQTGILPDSSPLTTAFDGQHLRLLTDKLSEKAGDLRAANARLRALINIGLELASERDTARLLQSVCAAARDLFGATYVTLGILDRTDQILERVLTVGADVTNWIKTGDAVPGILKTVVAERRTLRGDNPGGNPGTLQLPLLHPDVLSFLAAPFASPAHVYGWICLVGNEGRTFTENDEHLLTALSGQVGRIYENGYFYAAAQERARELEREIIERKQAESAQRYERDRAQRYLDTAEVILLALDLSGRITLVNRYACSILGWGADELLGRDWFDVCHPARLRNTLNDEFRNGLAGHLPIFEHPILTRSGEERLIAWRSTPQHDDAGHVIGTLSSGTDITARQQAEEDRMRFKDDFLSHVSHELRSPLTAIKQFTSILLGGLAGDLNKEQHQYQEIVLRNIGQLQSMIDDLIEVTRLETGKLTVEPERMSVSHAVTDTLDTLQGTALAKGVDLSWDLPPDLPSAHADETRLRQILIILLDNAIKFTPNGGTVRIRARLMPQDLRFLLIEVSDTGCGIKPEMMESIFERLYQVPEPTKASRKGLGLGLYICKELVTRQGGEIWVEAKRPEGSVFSFSLPVFSLSSLIAPLLENDEWPAKSVALVLVETCLPGSWPSKEAREAWSHEARSLLQRCLLPNLDVLLPKMSSGPEGEHFFVAAFADEKGASVLASRIREQFERLLHLKHTGLTVSVSYRMLQQAPRGVGAGKEHVVASMATALEASITSHITPEAA